MGKNYSKVWQLHHSFSFNFRLFHCPELLVRALLPLDDSVGPVEAQKSRQAAWAHCQAESCKISLLVQNLFFFPYLSNGPPSKLLMHTLFCWRSQMFGHGKRQLPTRSSLMSLFSCKGRQTCWLLSVPFSRLKSISVWQPLKQSISLVAVAPLACALPWPPLAPPATTATNFANVNLFCQRSKNQYFALQISRVHYPGLASHPEHDIARRQMKGYGGVVSFEVGVFTLSLENENYHLFSKASG